jgi:hypothetical protein
MFLPNILIFYLNFCCYLLVRDIQYSLILRNRDNGISIVTVLLAVWSNVRFLAGARKFSLLKNVQIGTETHPASYSGRTGSSLRVVKRWSLPLNSTTAEVKNVWSYTSAPACLIFLTGTILHLPCNSPLLLKVFMKSYSVTFMSWCSGVVVETLIVSAGFDVLKELTIKGAFSCHVTPFSALFRAPSQELGLLKEQ